MVLMSNMCGAELTSARLSQKNVISSIIRFAAVSCPLSACNRLGQILSLAFVMAFFLLGNVTLAHGQATSGSITGFVSDSSGASIANARVLVTNEATGIVTEAMTDGSGFYNVTHVIAGQYTVKVEQAGFKTYSKEHIELQIDSTVRADAQLAVGPASEVMTVTAAAATLKTEKTDVDLVLDQHALETLPVNNDNLTSLYLVAPGVVPHSFQIGNNENPSEGFMTSVNGQLWMANDYQVDGISDIAWGFTGLQIIVPPPDSVQELKVTTATYDPEFGSVGGLVAQFVTKSGGNAFHGSAYWQNRNASFFAANPFTEKVAGTGPHGTGTGVSPYNENIGGVSLGGPILRNKIFFFGDYRLNRRLVGANLLTTVPNDAFRTGDFSSLASTNPIFDPSTGNPDGTGRTQFPDNKIPVARFNPTSANLLALLPHANANQNTQQNYLGTGKSPFSTDEVDGRIDWKLSERDQIFGRYSYFWSHLSSPGVFGIVAGGPSIGGGNPATTSSRNQLLSMNYTHTFNPTLLGELRVGYARFHLKEYQNDSGLQTNNQVGIPNINDGTALAGGLAGVSIAGPVGSFQMGIFGSVPRLDLSMMIQVVNNWTKTAGNHELRWGADIRRNYENLFTLNQSTRGEFDFNQTVTGSPTVSNSGLSIASFLLGTPSFFQRGEFILAPDERATRISGYGGDNWRITPKMTVNYGLRWDYISPITPKKAGGDVNYDFNTGNLILAGLGGVSKFSNVQPRYNNLAERVGFAYKLTEKTVLRGGLGRSYFINGFDAAFNHLDSSYPIAQAQVINQSSLYAPIFPINQGPPTPAPPVFPASGHLAPPANDFVKAFPFERKTSSVDSWNLAIQRQFSKDFTLTAAYVANKGNNLDYSYYNVDAAPPAPGDLLSRRPEYIKFGFTGQIYVNDTNDHSNYNSVQIEASKRFSKGYSVDSIFTWAKAMDDQIGNRGPQGNNPYDLAGSYGVSYLNRAVVWTTTHSLQIPFGRGRAFGSGSNMIVNTVLGGWSFDGVTTIQSGLALSPTDSDSSTLNADFAQRPNRVPGVSLYPKSKNRLKFLNVAAFQTPPTCCVWGNAHPGSMRGPAFYNADLSLGKSFAFNTPLYAEPTTLELRVENFNALNHTNLGSPVNDINNPQYGQIFNTQEDLRRTQFDVHLRF